VWLPTKAWSGRYYQLGNGGFAGNIHLPSLRAEVDRGNATAATDTGHQGTGFDASWALGHPERVIDYGHRSIKTTSDAARILISAYYGRDATKRYFAGCSNGGRQALMAAQRYPSDWDGILAGAPANMWTQQLRSFQNIQHRLRIRPENWLGTETLAIIRQAAQASCPAASVQGTVALNPTLCRFRPTKLKCKGNEKSCLTSGQTRSVQTIMHEGYDPTSATQANWGRWIVNPDSGADSQLTFAEQSHRYLLKQDPSWSILTGKSPSKKAELDVAKILDSDSIDLARYHTRGGKIISYFGWADAVVSPYQGVRYYNRVADRAGGFDAVRKYYRLFMVPAMEHCQGGAPGYAFGQSISAPAAFQTQQYDIRLALEAWVEQGVAPDKITAVATTPGMKGDNWPSNLHLEPWPEH
jgi:feruloyl esterase